MTVGNRKIAAHRPFFKETFSIFLSSFFTLLTYGWVNCSFFGSQVSVFIFFNIWNSSFFYKESWSFVNFPKSERESRGVGEIDFFFENGYHCLGGISIPVTLCGFSALLLSRFEVCVCVCVCVCVRVFVFDLLIDIFLLALFVFLRNDPVLLKLISDGVSFANEEFLENRVIAFR